MKTKKNLSQNNVFWKQFDLNKTNILLGQAIALYHFHVKFNEAKKNDEINNILYKEKRASENAILFLQQNDTRER